MLEKRTIGDSAYERIKDDIIHLRFTPGEKLSEAALSKLYDISRAPIRVALGRLKEEGLIEIRPQSGSIVCPISIDRAVNILDVRLLLEPYAVMQAIPRITDEDIQALDEMFARLDRMTPLSEERSRYISVVDIELHNLIFRCSGNIIIPEVINRYAAEIQRVRRVNIQWKDRMVPSEQEMRAIFIALKARDTTAACTAMHTHLSNIRATIINPDAHADHHA